MSKFFVSFLRKGKKIYSFKREIFTIQLEYLVKAEFLDELQWKGRNSSKTAFYAILE